MIYWQGICRSNYFRTIPSFALKFHTPILTPNDSDPFWNRGLAGWHNLCVTSEKRCVESSILIPLSSITSRIYPGRILSPGHLACNDLKSGKQETSCMDFHTLSIVCEDEGYASQVDRRRLEDLHLSTSLERPQQHHWWVRLR